MSRQIEDQFQLGPLSFTFIGAEDIYSLFDPEAHGLVPESPHTACWKGFVLYFSIKDNCLTLHKLAVNCKNDVYPTINGVTPTLDEDGIFHEYNDLDMPIKYTGTIVIGKDRDSFYSNSSFTLPHHFASTFNMRFENGALTEFKKREE